MDFGLGPIGKALAGGLLSAGLVALGTGLPALRRGWGGAVLALAAGTLLGAAIFSLGLPAASHLAATGDFLATVLPLMAGILLGAGGGRALNQGLDHLALRWREHGPWPAAAVLALHNLPEGLALGAGLAVGNPVQGLTVLGGIGLHNLLEGAALAVLARGAGWTQIQVAGLAFLAGLAEPLGALAGAGISVGRPQALPWVLMVTAGALIEIVRGEILPAVRGRGPVLPGILVLAFAVLAVLSLVFHRA